MTRNFHQHLKLRKYQQFSWETQLQANAHLFHTAQA